MELRIPVLGGEIWAEDTADDGPAVVWVNADWGTAGNWSPDPARLAEIIAGRVSSPRR